MAAGDTLQGRRRENIEFGDLPDDLQPGDYWRYTVGGELLEAGDDARARGNLTGGVWGFASPRGGGIGTLRLHTVREHDDGTATIAPGDGSSNSVLIEGGADGLGWHGYLEHGVWREV